MTTATLFWTWTQIYAKIADEFDLDAEDFISEAEMMSYANDAVKKAESIVHQLNEDYFLSYASLSLVSGTQLYALPANIFAQKVRTILYTNGTNVYEIHRLTRLSKMLESRLRVASGQTSLTERLSYFLVNLTAAVPQILLTPTVRETGVLGEIWYYRAANRFTTGSDVCDIPEFANYVFEHLRERVSWKQEAGSPAHLKAVSDVQASEQSMRDTLKNMVVDGADLIDADHRHYEEHY